MKRNFLFFFPRPLFAGSFDLRPVELNRTEELTGLIFSAYTNKDRIRQQFDGEMNR